MITIKTARGGIIKEIIEGIKIWEDKGWVEAKEEALYKKIQYEMAIRGDRIMLEKIIPEKDKENERKAEEAAIKRQEEEVEEIYLKHIG